ncbi:hypothetical protein [Lonepinella sp. BR2271]|uniref:hypothetical protein n=1 Tax=Lonepinella sp. BR2271 TaxID=3434550 RepID=UPI003F6DD4A7
MKKLIATTLLTAFFALSSSSVFAAQNLQQIEKAIKNHTPIAEYLRDLMELANEGNIDAQIYVMSLSTFVNQGVDKELMMSLLVDLVEMKESCNKKEPHLYCIKWLKMKKKVSGE